MTGRRAVLRTLIAGGLSAGLGCRTSSGPGDSRPSPEARPVGDRPTPSSGSTGYVQDPRYRDHPHSTERPARLTFIEERLQSSGLSSRLVPIAPEEGADLPSRIARVHSAQHIAAVSQIPRTGPVAALAVGGVLAAVRAVCQGQVKNAFCAIRPPGHHAHDAGGEEGFCFYGNAAIAARHAQAFHGVERVLIVDWDYHHGNGTEWAFYSDPSVYFFSTHDWHAYPGTGDPARTGEGPGQGFNMNVPMEPGSGDAAFRKVFEERLRPAAEAFKPQLVLISAGFDSKRNDQLGQFDLTPCGFARLTEEVMAIAAAHAGGRLVSLLEGGYADRDAAPANTFHGLASCVEAHVATLLAGGAASSCSAA